MRPDEILLRHYKPSNRNMWTDDDPNSPPRLKSGAIQFLPDGCSVFRDAVLEAAQITREKALPSAEHAFAAATVAGVEAIQVGEVALTVVDDAWPDGVDPDRPHQAAHALVKPQGTVSNGQRDRLASKLARLLQPVALVR